MSDPSFQSVKELHEWLSARGRECNALKAEHGTMAAAQPLIAPILEQCRRVITAHPQFLGQKEATK